MSKIWVCYRRTPSCCRSPGHAARPAALPRHAFRDFSSYARANYSGNRCLAWDKANDMVCSWIFTSLEGSIKDSVLYYTMAAEIWADLEERFGEPLGTRLYTLRQEGHRIEQGGVSIMPSFLMKFFPSILKNASKLKPDMYCIYNSHALTSFTSSLFIAGLFSSLLAGRVTTIFGRKFTMLVGGCTFLLGSSINAAAENLPMLIVGRIFLGFGVGFTNQAVPVYLSEIAPAKWRGAFTTGFQFFIAIGVLISNIINYRATKLKSGWRLSLGLAGVPALIMTVGALFLTDSPSSLIQRGKLDEAKLALRKIRGTVLEADVDGEIIALSTANDNKHTPPHNSPTKLPTIFARQYRPQLTIAILIPFFQQVSGIDIIAFYAPVLFQSVGFGHNSALIAAIVLGSTNLFSILISSTVVDRFGRRFLFLIGGIQMFICQVAISVVLRTSENSDGSAIPHGKSVLILVLMCMYALGFGWSWGPLNWIVPSEIMPLKIRPTGQSISVAVNFATTFVLSQTFLEMLCKLRYGVFLFHAGWIAVMTLFIAFFMPETKGIALESMEGVWKKHWYWKRFVKDY